MTTRHATPGAGGHRPDASMTLINEVYSTSLDEGYALVARRRAAGDAPRPGARRRAVTLVVAVAVGLACSAATLALYQPTAAAQQARDLLESSIVERNDEVSALQQEATSLSAHIAALQSALVGAGSSDLQALAAAGAVEAGQVAVSGPGLRVQLSDAPSAQTDASDDDSRVQDVDLQIVVNGLWAAGAEAVAINSQRITATTAIRSAGSAVLVDLVPLSGPYRVEAIGNSVTLQTGLAQSTAGQLLTALGSNYDIGVEISRQDSLTLPGVGQVTLRYASVPEAELPQALRPTPEPSASATATTQERSTSPLVGAPQTGSANPSSSTTVSAVSSDAAVVAVSAQHAAADSPGGAAARPGEDRQ